jgi:UDP-N-acetylglucosamine--N-acetylmuramyl-(pentapeptide) pyrophosphoryl-undecaprenol N-acetylglucosamine transferase
VVEALRVAHPACEVLWVGGEGGMEAGLIQRAGLPFHTIPAAGVHGVGLRALPGNLLQLARGLLAARRILHQFHPDVLFFTGGYLAVPMSLAGWRLPQFLYVPDIEPGLALKALARLASRIAITVEETRRFLPRPNLAVVTGYPTRPDLKTWERTAARQKFDLQSDLPVLLVFGGSKGAHSINMALLANLPTLLEKVQIIHISGELDWPVVQSQHQSLPSHLSNRYRPFPYLHEEMGAALAAADLAVSRAGASSLGEFPLFGLPAILVPYPHAWRYQKVNADYLKQHGAALVLEDADLQQSLVPTIFSLLEDAPRLEKMRLAMRALSIPDAASRLAVQIVTLTGKA